ncbi:hypothetical protein MO973_21100 [Paenibacillus sp. TRM 82003]|nr:hypothetical protein [Paenibacillus sp. TRM 82003]
MAGALMPLQASAPTERTSGGSAAKSEQWPVEYVNSKGVLERRIRLRSRLNTHLLMKKFQQ